MLLVRGDYVWTGKKLKTEAAVLCSGDKVLKIDSWEKLKSDYPEAEVVGGPGKIVLPGIINAHHHGNGITSFMVGVSDDALEPWLATLATSPAADPYLDTLWAAIGLLRGGYSTVVLFQSTLDPDRVGDEARARIRACLDAGLRVALGLDLTQQNFFVYGDPPQGLPARSGLSTDTYLQLLNQLMSEFSTEPNATVFAAPSGPQWVKGDAWQAIGAWTKQHQVPLHTHCLESPYEAEYAQRAYGGSVVRHLADLGALHAHTALVHGVYLSDDELDLLKTCDAALITNPGSNLRLRCGVSPVLRALERGVKVALGTDGCTLGERDDAFAEMRLLYYLQRGPGMTTPALTFHQALTTATTSAAQVTRWADHIGHIDQGTLADLCVYDLDEIRGPWSHPKIDPLQMMVQRAYADHLSHVIVGGKVAWERTRGPLHVDVDDIANRLRDYMKEQNLDTDNDWVSLVRAHFCDWPIPKKP